MKNEIFKLKEEFVTLGQLLKIYDLISSGGMAKWYLSEYMVRVNQEEENRRGRKLFDQDIVELLNEDLIIKIIK